MERARDQHGTSRDVYKIWKNSYGNKSLSAVTSWLRYDVVVEASSVVLWISFTI